MKKYSASEKEIKYLPLDYMPNDKDIVCGRGKACAKLQGNKEFMAILRANLDRYTAAKKRTDKTVVVASVVDIVLATGARFIKHDTETLRFYELNAAQVHEKCGHALRDLLKNDKHSPTKSDRLKKAMAAQRKRRASSLTLLGRELLLSLQQESFHDTINQHNGLLEKSELEQLEVIKNLAAIADQETLPVAPALIEDFEACEPSCTFPVPLRTASWNLPRQISYNLDDLITEEAKDFLDSDVLLEAEISVLEIPRFLVSLDARND